MRQPRDDATLDLLRRVFGILAVPQHAQGQAIKVALEIPHENVEGVTIPIDDPPGDSPLSANLNGLDSVLSCGLRMFQLDAQTVRDPVDKTKVRDDCAEIVNRSVVQSDGSKTIDVRGPNRSGRARQFLGVFEHRLIDGC